MTRYVLSLAIVVLALPCAAADELDQFRQREQLLAQKWNRDVAAAMDSSRQLERTDLAAAREMLQSALGQLKNASGLSDSQRSDLSRRLQGRIADISTNAMPPRPLAPPRPSAFAADAPRPPQVAQSATPPRGSVADTAKAFIDKQNGTLSKTNELKETRAAGFSGVVNGIQNSAVPTDRDMAFSPNHKEIAARRAPVVNAKEEAVMTALSMPIDADFTGMNFRDALEYIHKKSGLTLIPDGQSLKETNVEYDDPVNFKVSAKISVRAALRKILGDRGLSYTVGDGTVNIVTVQRAREATVVRIYPINDLVTPLRPQPQFVAGPFGYVPVAPGTFPTGTPGVTPTFNQQMGQTIADMVRTSVDPTYWAPNGPGTITFNETTGSLIVRASAEVHFMINGSLNRR